MRDAANPLTCEMSPSGQEHHAIEPPTPTPNQKEIWRLSQDVPGPPHPILSLGLCEGVHVKGTLYVYLKEATGTSDPQLPCALLVL